MVGIVLLVAVLFGEALLSTHDRVTHWMLIVVRVVGGLVVALRGLLLTLFLFLGHGHFHVLVLHGLVQLTVVVFLGVVELAR